MILGTNRMENNNTHFLKTDDNKIVSPPLEDLSPILERKKFFSEMIIPVHQKSKNIK